MMRTIWRRVQGGKPIEIGVDAVLVKGWSTYIYKVSYMR